MNPRTKQIIDKYKYRVDDSSPMKKLVKMHDKEIGLQYEPGDMRHGRKLEVGYGHIRKHQGADGMSLDVYLGANLESKKVYQVEQLTQDGQFDERKVMLGFDSIEEAKAAYLKAMPEKFFGSIKELDWQDLKNRIDNFISRLASGKQDEAVFVNKELHARVKAEAKRKFKVFPSFYASAWLKREYARRGGKLQG